MKQTILKIQELVDDIHGDVKILKLTLIANKVERLRQLFEGVVQEFRSIPKDEK